MANEINHEAGLYDRAQEEYQEEISLLPLTARALDYLESATGHSAGFWAVNVKPAQLIDARKFGFRFC